MPFTVYVACAFLLISIVKHFNAAFTLPFSVPIPPNLSYLLVFAGWKRLKVPFDFANVCSKLFRVLHALKTLSFFPRFFAICAFDVDGPSLLFKSRCPSLLFKSRCPSLSIECSSSLVTYFQAM